jgi:hypothetical protein
MLGQDKKFYLWELFVCFAVKCLTRGNVNLAENSCTLGVHAGRRELVISESAEYSFPWFIHSQWDRLQNAT